MKPAGALSTPSITYEAIFPNPRRYPIDPSLVTGHSLFCAPKSGHFLFYHPYNEFPLLRYAGYPLLYLHYSSMHVPTPTLIIYSYAITPL